MQTDWIMTIDDCFNEFSYQYVISFKHGSTWPTDACGTEFVYQATD